MNELVRASLQFPTIILTVLVAIALVYWLSVIVGALDIDLLGDAEGGDGGGGDAGPTAGFLSALGLSKVPLTISLTAIFMVAWVLCVLGTTYGATLVGEGMASWLLGSIVLLLALAIALPASGLLVRPLAPIFHVHQARSRAHYVGAVCTITTGHVDGDFGQATIEDGGDVLVIPVRCDAEGNGLGRNHKALVIEHDDAREAYIVEPVAGLLGTEKSGKDS